MKTNKNIYIALLCTLFFGVSSCESDSNFLRESPSSFYTIDNAFNTSKQIQSAVTSLYAHVRSVVFTNENSVVLLRGNGTDVFDVPSFRISNSLTDYTKLTPENGLIYNNYFHWYQLISKANLVLYGANLQNITWDKEEERKYALAQAKFFRAYAYRNLGELFGGVPIVQEIITVPKYDFVRSSRVETYQFAIKDLEEAVLDLPEATSDAGRIVKGAAYHYLSELYLAIGTEYELNGGGDASASFIKSVDYASEVIDGNMYELMNQRFGSRQNVEGKSVYWDLFQTNNVDYQDGNRESIWSIQVDYVAYKAEDKQSYLPFPRIFSPALGDLVGIDENGKAYKPFSVSQPGNEILRGGRGITLVTPTYYVRDIIWEGELYDDMRNKDHNIVREIICNNPDFPNMHGKPIPESVLNYDDKSRTVAYPIWMKWTTDIYEGINEGQNYSNLFRDEYIIRLSETILLRAEANYRLGDRQKACDDINRIRDRAKCTYRATVSDVSLDFILDERTRELFVEENRWNTLLRMGGTVAVDRIKKYAYWKETVKATLKGNYNLWPIPQQVIDRNKDVPMAQNPGW